jgi:hypothetical protein
MKANYGILFCTTHHVMYDMITYNMYIISIYYTSFPPFVDITLLRELRCENRLTGLLAGKQGWKCPVALLATCCGSKSLKVILLNSDFRAYSVLNPLVTLYLTPSSRKDFFEGKNFFFDQALRRAKQGTKDGGWRSVPYTLCRLFQTCSRIGVYPSSEEHLHRSLTRQGLG